MHTVLIVRCRNSVSAASRRVWTSCFIVMHEAICCGLFNDASAVYAVERQWRTTLARTHSRTWSGVKVTWNSMFNNTKAGRVKWLVPSCAQAFREYRLRWVRTKVGELQLEHHTGGWDQIIRLFYIVSSWMMVGCDELERMWRLRWPVLR
jgi:hypothetical protein